MNFHAAPGRSISFDITHEQRSAVLKPSILGLATAAVLSLFPATGHAEADISLSVHRITLETVIHDGVETEVRSYDSVSSAVPGELLAYRIDLVGSGDAPLEDVRMVLPVNANLTLVPESFRSNIDAEMELSVDGGTTFGPLEALTVTQDGQIRSAVADDITSIAITVPVLPEGASALIEYDVRVD